MMMREMMKVKDECNKKENVRGGGRESQKVEKI